MPTLDLTDEQATALFRQLPRRQQIQIVSEVAEMSPIRREELREHGMAVLRRVCAERGLDFDSMSDEERLYFVSDYIEEEDE